MQLRSGIMARETRITPQVRTQMPHATHQRDKRASKPKPDK